MKSAFQRCKENWETAAVPLSIMVDSVRMLHTQPRDPWGNSREVLSKENALVKRFFDALEEPDLNKAIQDFKNIKRGFKSLSGYLHGIIAGDIDRALQELNGYQRSLQHKSYSIER